MLALKKENARLKRQAEELEAAAAAAAQPPPDVLGRTGGGSDGPYGSVRPGSALPVSPAGGEGGGTPPRLGELMARQAEAEARYREMTAKLKRLLEVERRNLRAVRAAHAKDLQGRTELEGMLRACSDEVRREIALHRAAGKGAGAAARPGSNPGREVAVAAMTAADRERVLELLLSQERVVELLYDKAFPHSARGGGPVEGGVEFVGYGGGGGGSDAEEPPCESEP